MPGTSAYPGALDDFALASPTNLGDSDIKGRTHSERSDDMEAAMEAVQAELGTDPAGASATVKARFDVIEASGWVTSARIADGTIATGDLADGAVTSAKIADGTIATADIADAAITTAKIAAGAVVTADLADASVTTAKIADDAVTPAKVSVPILSSGLYLSGASGNYASAPDDAALDITGDLDIRCEVALADWTPAATTGLVSKFGSAGTRSYQLYISSAGNVGLRWSTDGTTIITQDSTAATGITDGVRRWVRAALDVDDGGVYKVYFYTSTDGVTWTQLGTTRTGGSTTSIFASTSILAVGSDSNGTGNLATGTFYRAQVRSGIAGTIVANPDFRLPFDGRHRDSAGDTWTLTGSAWAWVTEEAA